jgi:Cu-processing system ATP-binding protein
VIEVKGIYKQFNKNVVLSDLGLNIDEKGIFAILGPNGSGKTTLIKAILGMVIPYKGSIRVAGEDVTKSSDYRHHIDYLPQIANFPSNLKVTELINMIKDLRGGAEREQKLIEQFGLTQYMDKKLGNLSGGTKQKVNILLAFMFDSPILILDEPTTGLDPLALIQLKKLISEEKAKGKTILITSHIMSFVEEVSDEIVFLLEGNIKFKGAVQKLKADTGQSDLEHAIAVLLEKDHV